MVIETKTRLVNERISIGKPHRKPPISDVTYMMDNDAEASTIPMPNIENPKCILFIENIELGNPKINPQSPKKDIIHASEL